MGRDAPPAEAVAQQIAPGDSVRRPGSLCGRGIPALPGESELSLGKLAAERGDRGEGPAGEDQVDADEKADRPVGGAGELGEDEDADQQAGDAAEADQAGVRLAAADEGD